MGLAPVDLAPFPKICQRLRLVVLAADHWVVDRICCCVGLPAKRQRLNGEVKESLNLEGFLRMAEYTLEDHLMRCVSIHLGYSLGK